MRRASCIVHAQVEELKKQLLAAKEEAERDKARALLVQQVELTGSVEAARATHSAQLPLHSSPLCIHCAPASGSRRLQCAFRRAGRR